MIDFQYIESQKINNSKAISLWLIDVVKKEGKEIGELVYVLCKDDYLLKKNIQFLNHNTLTDVITFDYCKEGLINGDILISTERVEENSREFNVDYLTELQRVMVHGLLHLLGYKDKSKEDIKIMREKENFYLTNFITD
jgi:probable rRNA maturation factor